MRNLWLRLQRRWVQFRIETESRLDSFLGVVVNLHFSRYQQTQLVRITVLVDSWREMFLLALLRTLAILPMHDVYVIRRSDEICRVVSRKVGENIVIIVTKTLYAKRYQSFLESDFKNSLLII